jgi:WD40 repeat protein
LSNGTIASGSRKAIKFWDSNLDSQVCIKSVHIDGYKDYNDILVLSNDNIACTAHNKERQNILVLDSNDKYKCIKVIEDYKTSIIYKLVNLSAGKFAWPVGDDIKIWDFNANFHCSTLCGHSRKVYCLLYLEKENLMVSGSNDKTKKIWSVSDKQCIRTINAHTRGVTCLVMLPGAIRLLVVYKCIKIWRFCDFECVKEIHDDDMVTSLLLLRDYRLVSASFKEIITIWGY